MSQPCDIVECKRLSRALCHCCNQNLCFNHFAEHNELLNSQLNPIADQINALNERMHQINVNAVLGNLHGQIDAWAINVHRIVDTYVQEKKVKLDEYFRGKLNTQKNELQALNVAIRDLVQRQETTPDDLTAMALVIQSIGDEINQIEENCAELHLGSFRLDDSLILVEGREDQVARDLNLARLGPPIRVIDRSVESGKPIASNYRSLLMHQDDHLCLMNPDLTVIKQIRWPHGWIWDMCWSAAIARYFIITLNSIFTLEESQMSLERIEYRETTALASCTCSNSSLFITTNEVDSSILEFKLAPKIELINRWKPADLCRPNEIIQDIVYHRRTFAFIIENHDRQTKRLELRSSRNFEQIWSLDFEQIDPLHNAFRLCSFNTNEWLVVAWKTAQIFHVTQDGQLKTTYTYDSIPYRCCEFGPNLLVISTRMSLNFHQL
jgi:hypothetical protein